MQYSPSMTASIRRIRNEGGAVRLVKLLLPTDLIRAMDRAILASVGGYGDRHEFVAEAIRDRLVSDRATALGFADLSSDVPASPVEAATDHALPALPLSPSALPRLHAEALPAATVTGGVLFGLHNRDLPSLVSLAVLCEMCVGEEGAVLWRDFTANVRVRARVLGEALRQRDAGRLPGTMKTATGFPRPGVKERDSEERFVAASVGAANGTGPLFLLGLAKFGDAGRVRPTREGYELLLQLAKAGIGEGMPHSRPALILWRDHILAFAPEESAMWTHVLRLIARRPTRDELVDSLDGTSRSVAETNVMGWVSRWREWGAVQPELVDRRYRLTDVGEWLEGTLTR